MEKSIYTREYTAFLRQLREARRASGVTQEELARRLKQTQSTISKIERGERRLDVIELRRVCRALGINFPKFVRRINTTLTRNLD